MIRSRVDLPPPDGPSRAVSWPFGMVTETSSSATKSPKRLVTPETSMLMRVDSLGRRSETTTMQSTATNASTNDVAYAVDCSKFWYFCSTTRVAVWVSPVKLPDTILTAPNSPMERASDRTTPYTTAHLMLGRVIRRNVWRAPAPRLRAACSWSSPISLRTGTTSRMTRGRATKQVAMIMPGVLKMTW